MKQAEALAKYTADRTLGASARIIPTNKVMKLTNVSVPKVREDKFRGFKIRKGKRIATPNVWIEKRKFRLDHPNEKQTIQRFRKSKVFKRILGGRKKK